jgi:membrane protease YdiL (CAAX protease family)
MESPRAVATPRVLPLPFMHADEVSNEQRTRALMLWALLPCAAMWVGLYDLKSAFWSYALYHVICLAPAIVWGRSLWLPTVIKPTVRDCLLLLGAAIVFSAGAVLGYELIGKMLLSNEHVLALLKKQGITGHLFVFFGFYATIVNPILEELFWRGVVLNAFDQAGSRFRYFGITLSSLLYALFHYLIFRLVLFPGYAEVGTLLLAGYGALMALIYRKTGSIVTTALAHGLLTDLACVVLLVYYFNKYGTP